MIKSLSIKDVEYISFRLAKELMEYDEPIPVRYSAFNILKELDLSPKIRCKRNVQLEKWNDIVKYFNLIGTSNLKHKRKFEKAFGGVGSGCPKRS